MSRIIATKREQIASKLPQKCCINRRFFVILGQEIEAVVLELPHTDHVLELSLRATLPDPWQAFITAHRTGDVIAGKVKDGIATNGAICQPGGDGD